MVKLGCSETKFSTPVNQHWLFIRQKKFRVREQGMHLGAAFCFSLMCARVPLLSAYDAAAANPREN
jgi:hypothetical protein